MKFYKGLGLGTQAFVLFFFISTSSCKEDVPISESESVFDYPEYFPEPNYNNEENAFTAERFELGRLLFYDSKLSIDSSVSCATCHAQVHGFADHGTKFSRGVYGRTGDRNSPAIFNMAWNTSFMWDGGINHIEVMPLAPITNPNEMDMDMRNLLTRLNADARYKGLFQVAYGKDSISDKHLFYALSQFMTSIVSDESDYDQYRKTGSGLSEQQLNGMKIVERECGSCHPGPLFTSNDLRNNGLSLNNFGDEGHARISQDSGDIGKFKVPSLRNLKFTYPYMHDGRFRTLDQVLDYYSNRSKEPDAPEDIRKIELSEEEKKDVKAFLNALNDLELLSNKKWGDPNS